MGSVFLGPQVNPRPGDLRLDPAFRAGPWTASRDFRSFGIAEPSMSASIKDKGYGSYIGFRV